MDYPHTLTYLKSLEPKAFRMELGPLLEACHLMSNPENKFPSVHISGTNGKGSTAAFVEAILSKSGYKAGLYTSPHLIDVRERIQINREMISPDDLSRITEKIRSNLPDDRHLSFFEFMTLVSFMWFAEQKVDIAVIETGLGGRLDATNVITPKVSVITPISFDHTAHLGNTLKDIATEKCGIIKRGIPTVVAYQVPQVMDVIRRFCDDIGSPLCLATPDEITSPLGLLGDHQKQNAACAVEAAGLLAQAGFKIKNVEEAIAETKWPGRIETVSTNPRVIVDGAHNVAGAEMLASYVRHTIPREKAVLLLGVLADKDVSGIVRSLTPLFREVVCVKAPSDRAVSPKDLAAATRSSGVKVSVEKGVSEALSKIMGSLGKDDTLIVSGSLTMVGEAKLFFTKGATIKTS